MSTLFFKEVVGQHIAKTRGTIVRAEYIPERMDWRLIDQVDFDIVYLSMYSWIAPDMQQSVLHNIVFDFDSVILQEAEADVKNFLSLLSSIHGIDLNTVGIWFSGWKGFHVVIPVGAFVRGTSYISSVPPSALKLFAHELAGSFSTFDRSIYDERRIIRVPLGENINSGLVKHRVSYEDLLSGKRFGIPTSEENIDIDDAVYSEALGELFLKALALCSAPPTKRNAGLHEPIQNLFMPAKKGTRNANAAKLAGLIAKHIDDLAVLQFIMDMWNRLNDEPLPDKELSGLVGRIFRNHKHKTVRGF